MIDINADFPYLTPSQVRWMFKRTMPRLYKRQLTDIAGVNIRAIHYWLSDSREFVPIKAVQAIKLLFDSSQMMQFRAISQLYNNYVLEGKIIENY